MLSFIEWGVLGLSSLPKRQAACLENTPFDESALGDSSGEIGTRLPPQAQMANRSLSAIEVRNLVLCGGGGELLRPPPPSPPPPRNAANSTARERRSSPNVTLTPPFAHSPTPRFSLSRPLCQCIPARLGYTGREHAREARWGSICAQGESGAREPPPSQRTDKLSSAQEVPRFAINAGAGEHLCPPTPRPLPPRNVAHARFALFLLCWGFLIAVRASSAPGTCLALNIDYDLIARALCKHNRVLSAV